MYQTCCLSVINSAAGVNSPSCLFTDTTDTLIDLAGLDTPSPPQPAPPPSQASQPFFADPTANPIPFLPPPPKRLAGSHGSQSSSPSHPPLDTASTAFSLLDDELLSLGTISQRVQDVVLCEVWRLWMLCSPNMARQYEKKVILLWWCKMLLSGLNDPPPSLSSQSKPKLNEVSNQWTSLQVNLKRVCEQLSPDDLVSLCDYRDSFRPLLVSSSPRLLVSSAGSGIQRGFVWQCSLLGSSGAPCWAGRQRKQSPEPAGPGHDGLFGSEEVQSSILFLSLLFNWKSALSNVTRAQCDFQCDEQHDGQRKQLWGGNSCSSTSSSNWTGLSLLSLSSPGDHARLSCPVPR